MKKARNVEQPTRKQPKIIQKSLEINWSNENSDPFQARKLNFLTISGSTYLMTWYFFKAYDNQS